MILKPYLNIGTGEFIKEELEARNWKQEDLAEVLGISLKSVNKLIKSKQSITIEMAKLLSQAFGQSPQYWMNLDTNYRLRLLPNTEKESAVASRSEIFNYMPVKEMTKKGWLKKHSTIDQLVEQVKKFWEIPKVDFSILKSRALPAFRKSDAFSQYNQVYATVWFTMAKKCASAYKVSGFDRYALRKLAEKMYSFTIMKNGIRSFLSSLNKVGVKFIVLSHLQKTYIDGASFIDQRNPVIVYTCRHDRIDNFWFTLAHEIGHILYHLKGKDDIFLDDLDGSAKNKKEKEADYFAEKTIKGKDIAGYFTGTEHYISEILVNRCSRELKIHPAIIVGHLQHIHKLDRRNLNRFKEKVAHLIPVRYWIEKSI